ncbi:MAG: hypothetical protein JO180_01190 [Gemmatirosa sp.]|nr:hypothetical protein [Gemmatirosa sp.]
MTHPTASAAPAPAPLAPNAVPLGATLAWLVERAKLDDETRALVPDALTAGAADPGPLVQALLEADRMADALRVVGVALPPREGVWWAWVAARHAAEVAQTRADGPAPSAAQRSALAAAERWIAQPTDEHRRAAWDIAQVAGLDTPAGCVAAAIYFTGGSITPPNGPFVPPPAGIHATMASTATLLAALATDPEHLREVAGAFAQQGVEIVRRLGGWDAAAAVARQTFDAQAYQHAEAAKPPVLEGA